MPSLVDGTWTIICLGWIYGISTGRHPRNNLGGTTELFDTAQSAIDQRNVKSCSSVRFAALFKKTGAKRVFFCSQKTVGFLFNKSQISTQRQLEGLGGLAAQRGLVTVTGDSAGGATREGGGQRGQVRRQLRGAHLGELGGFGVRLGLGMLGQLQGLQQLILERCRSSEIKGRRREERRVEE